MNRRIPNGAYCLFRVHPTGSRQGKTVLVRHPDLHDPETGSYTVKRYESEKRRSGDGDDWQHRRIILRPDSNDPSFVPLIFEDGGADELRVIGELVEVLGD